jgi:hypothetical protein
MARSDATDTIGCNSMPTTIDSEAAPLPAGGLRRPSRSPLLLLVLLFVVSLPAVTTRLYSGDEIEYFAFLRSLWFDRDLSFDNEYRYFYDRGIARGFGFRETLLELSTPTGLRLNFGTLGCAILWAPFYAVADVGVAGARMWGSDVPADGFSWPYLAAVTCGSAVYGFLAVLISAHVARRVIGQGSRAALLVWLSTPLLFYMYLAPGMAHACSAFVVALFVAAWLRVRERWSPRGAVALAILAALMTMVREQDAFIAIGPGVDYLVTLGLAIRNRHVDSVRRLAIGGLAGVVAFAVAYLPQAMAYLALNGRFGPPPQIARKMSWTAPHALDVLLSVEHGFFFWTPLAMLSVAGLVWLAIRPAAGGTAGVGSTRWVGVLALLIVAGQIYVNGSIQSWSQAGAFGQRRFVALTVLLVLGLAQVLASVHAATLRRALIGVLGLCLWWNLGLMAQFGAGMMDRQRLQLDRNAYNTFVGVPARLPELAYRYVFDRGSFYQQPGRERAR